jgi:hypothetical protein
MAEGKDLSAYTFNAENCDLGVPKDDNLVSPGNQKMSKLPWHRFSDSKQM